MIKIKNLTKRYGDKIALNKVTFTVEAGDVVGLLGLDGAGKTTALNILAGCINATSGNVSIAGYDIMSNSREAKRLIGYLPEQPTFYKELTVYEHLEFICGIKGVFRNKFERKKHIDNICNQVGIFKIKKRRISNLSRAYKQRVGFAQALVGNPKVIILDEPTAGLDHSQIIEIRNLVQACAQKRTVIVSSFILSEIQSVCNRILLLHEGKLIAHDMHENLAKGVSLGDVFLRLIGFSG